MFLFHPGEKMQRFEILAFKKTLYKLKRKFSEMLKDVVCIAKTSYFEPVS